VNKILEERKIVETRAVPPKIALPIIEEASLEDDQTLQYLWNHLLANAMSPDFNDELRYGFVEMIKEITGIEAKLLDKFYEILRSEGRIRPLSELSEYVLKKEQIIHGFGISEDVYAVSVNNLMRMQLLSPGIFKVKGTQIGLLEPLTIYKGIDAVTLTPLGVKFIEACMR